jgi:hypothetical protein
VPRVWLGNPATVERVLDRNPDGTPRLTPAGHETHTRVPRPDSTHTWADPPDTLPIDVFLDQVRSFWPYHSDAPGPSWVACDQPEWATAVATRYGCDVVDVPTGEVPDAD